MISKRIADRRDGKSFALSALRYGEGIERGRRIRPNHHKSHRTRFGNFGVIPNGAYIGRNASDMAELIELAGIEMQANTELNTKVGPNKKIVHIVVSYHHHQPSEAVMRDTEDSMLEAMQLSKNHWVSFLHSDNGHWHQHFFISRIEKEWPHRGNGLWHDRINRDKVCREIEIRHSLERDAGLHLIDEFGNIVEVPRAERIANRELKEVTISDRAKTVEIHSGEQSFQSLCLEIRIGDRLKHANSWQELHATAAAYQCAIKPKGAGFVICPIGEKGGIQLSKLGIKNLAKKLGEFESAGFDLIPKPKFELEPKPTISEANDFFKTWRSEKEVYFRSLNDLKISQRSELENIRSQHKGSSAKTMISISKMQHAVAMTNFKVTNPGTTFRDYLLNQANRGNNSALSLVRKYGVVQVTPLLLNRESNKFGIYAGLSGQLNRTADLLRFDHRVERNGTIVFNIGQGRVIVDSAIANQVQLNQEAACNSDAIATALSYSASRFGKTLTLTGSIEFERLAVQTVVQKGLAIHFSDPVLQQYRQELIQMVGQKIELPRRQAVSGQLNRGIQQGAEHVETKTGIQGNRTIKSVPSNDVAGTYENATGIATSRGNGVHDVSHGSMECRPDNSDLLLQGHVQNSVRSLAEKDHDLRRPRTGQIGNDEKRGSLGQKGNGGSKPTEFHPGKSGGNKPGRGR